MNYKRCFLALGILGTLFISSCRNEYEKNSDGFYKISQVEAKEMIDNEDVYIVDVREVDEYEEGHIKNSILIPVGDIEKDIESVIENKNAKILVYCRTGKRSEVASSKMVKMGYKNEGEDTG